MNDNDLNHMHALENFPLNRSLDNFRWHKNPILEKGRAGEWDEMLIRDPMVIYDYNAPEDEKFKIYYCGQNSQGRMNIGLAYGRSLENLKKHSGNPVVEMTENFEKVSGIHHDFPKNHSPYVIYTPGKKTYEMLYTAYASEGIGRKSYHVSSTVRATSTDGKKWGNKKQVFKRFTLGKNNYTPQKPILHYNVEEKKYYLVFAASFLGKNNMNQNEGFTGLATSADGENYSFEKIIIPQDMAGSIYDPHGLVSMFGWYFLLVTHDSGQAYDSEGNSNWPERWLVTRDFRNWYGSPKSVWNTHPDEGYLYSHLTPLVTESGWAYFVYDYADDEDQHHGLCLAKVPYLGKPYNIILEKPVIKPGASTKLSDCYPAISLEHGGTLALTCECAYHSNASRPAKIHVYTSYDGKNWDTEEQRDDQGKPVFGSLALKPGGQVRETRGLKIQGRYVKVVVENEDPKQPLKNVKIIAIF